MLKNKNKIIFLENKKFLQNRAAIQNELEGTLRVKK
jgi:hypothetical protein